MKKILLSTLITMMLFANGEDLYRTCAGCHGENGETAALGQSKIIMGQESNLSIKQITAYKEGELNQYGLGNIMQLQLMSLNKDEIVELAEYIEKMQPKETSN